jgi:hypothetical protein
MAVEQGAIEVKYNQFHDSGTALGRAADGIAAGLSDGNRVGIIIRVSLAGAGSLWLYYCPAPRLY